MRYKGVCVDFIGILWSCGLRGEGRREGSGVE